MGFLSYARPPTSAAGMFLPTRETIDVAHVGLNRALSSSGGPNLHLGFENYWDEVFLERVEQEAIPSYDDGVAFLFEVPPPFMPSGIEDKLFSIRLQGKLPVMAHPERYVAIQTQMERAASIGRCSALVIDLAALDGAHGKAEKRTARHLVQDRLVHAAATDIHGPDDARAIAAGITWLRKHMGEQTVRALLVDNPRQILAGELPETR